MATSKFRVPGLEAWVKKIGTELSENAARDIVIDLKIKGPYWSGEFESHWVVAKGSKEIPMTLESKYGAFPPRKERDITDIKIPEANKRGDTVYTIGNRMVYTPIALDLVPGRLGKAGNIAYSDQPPQDWFDRYRTLDLAERLKNTTNKVAKLSSIKNFKGRA